MITIEIALFLGGVAAILALYSFLERNSWMYSQITSSLLSASLLWILTAITASNNICIYYCINEKISTIPIEDPSLPIITSLFAIVMSVYCVLHIVVCLQDYLENKKEED